MKLIDKNLLKDGACKVVVKKGSNKRIIEGIYNSKLNTVFFICNYDFLLSKDKKLSNGKYLIFVNGRLND